MAKFLNILVALVFLGSLAGSRAASSPDALQSDSATRQSAVAAATATQLGNGVDAAQQETALADSVQALHRQVDKLALTVQTLRDDTVTKKQMWGYMLALAAVLLVVLLAVYAKLSAAVSRKSSGRAATGSSDSACNAELQVLKTRVANAEQRLAKVEAEREKLVVAVAARHAAQPVMASNAAVKATTANASGLGVFYAKTLSAHGTLDIMKQKDMRREEAVFEFRHTDASHAKFTVCGNDRMMRWAIENRQTVLEPVCDIMSDDGVSRVETKDEGEAELVGGNWTVTHRAKIIIR